MEPPLNDTARYKQVNDLLVQLEESLNSALLWQSAPIDAEALQSTAPFCCDTMSFAQWIQFVFIPRMHQLVATQSALPAHFSLLPMLEMSYPKQAEYEALYATITELDALFN